MVAFRALGWLLLALAVAVVVHDLLTWWSEGSYPFSTLGSLWSHLDPGSLGSVQTSARRHLPGSLWGWTVQPFLALPAELVPEAPLLGIAPETWWRAGELAVLAGLGLAMLFLGVRPALRRLLPPLLAGIEARTGTPLSSHNALAA